MINRERFFSSLRLPEWWYPLPDKIPQGLVKKLLLETKQWGSLPVDLEPIMSGRGIKNVFPREKSFGANTVLILRRDKNGDYFEIELKDELSSKEARLSIAHEIGHNLFYNIASQPFSLPTKDWSLVYAYKNRGLEHFCGMFARELLMPRELLEKETAKFAKPGEVGFGANSLIKLANLFKVPTESMARRLVEDLGIWEAIIFQLKYSQLEFSPGQWLLKWVVPFDTEDPIPDYSPLSVGSQESMIAQDTISSKQRVFKLKIDLHDIRSESSFWGYLPEGIRQQIEEEEEILVFSSSNLDEGIQLPLFKWYELESKGFSWFPYLCEIAQIVCVIPLKKEIF